MTQTTVGSLGDDMVWPPGFRFHPTDEELVLYYLKRKISHKKLKLDIISVVDVYKWDPEDLPGLSLLKTGDRQWFFFSPRDRKHPNGSRANRATRHGYWKATGKDRSISCNSRIVGVKKTLVFYEGRAPSGERTDWVMHEYTLDDDELKRCQNIQDYYALCKVYKKSGPGPKNGEQYGALFKEEDWADDENPKIGNPAQENPVWQVDEVASVDDCSVDPHLQSELHDLEELLNQLVDVPAMEHALGNADNYVNALPLADCEGEPQAESCVGHQQSSWRSGTAANFDSTKLTASQLQCEAPQPTILANAADLQHHVAQLDYLEMDDLLVPETAFDAAGVIDALPFSGRYSSPHVEEPDGLSELDLYYDAAMFLQELCPGPPDGEAIDTLVDQTALTWPDPNAQCIELVYPVKYRMHQHQAITDGAASKLWTHDESRFNPCSAQVADESASLPSSGVYAETSFVSNATQLNQNQSNDAVGAEPWLTSALWSFVESIPSTPASAAETILVNQALERISSFSRLSINAKGITSATGTGTDGGRMRGFFLFSLLGALLAVFLVIIGTIFGNI
ncbi:hypothetical protein Dimus_024707 [Dionaea muscipula]